MTSFAATASMTFPAVILFSGLLGSKPGDQVVCWTLLTGEFIGILLGAFSATVTRATSLVLGRVVVGSGMAMARGDAGAGTALS